MTIEKMEDVNRIKVVLVERKKTGKWLSEQLGKTHQPYKNGVPMARNQI